MFSVIVDLKCVYTEKDTLSDAKFDPATQICCQKSGVHERFQQGKEMDCCGGKKYITMLRIIHCEQKWMNVQKNNDKT